jgi:hypothetical protein
MVVAEAVTWLWMSPAAAIASYSLTSCALYQMLLMQDLCACITDHQIHNHPRGLLQ